jgi:hypothetical protein
MPFILAKKQPDEECKLRPNYAFKPTAGEVCRSNQPLLAGGGLTRRYATTRGDGGL